MKIKCHSTMSIFWEIGQAPAIFIFVSWESTCKIITWQMLNMNCLNKKKKKHKLREEVGWHPLVGFGERHRWMCSINTLLKYVNLSKNEKIYLQIIIIMAFTLALFKKLLRKYPIYFLKFFPVISGFCILY